MLRTLLAITMLLFTCFSQAQDTIVNQLKSLSDSRRYDEVVSHVPKSKDYPARALYYIGLAYYMREDDANTLRFMDQSIAKDSKDAAPHFIKGSTYNYMQKYDDAIKCFQQAIKLKDNDPDFYSGMGDSYYNKKNYKLALESYGKATLQPACPERPYLMVAQIYNDSKQTAKALEAYSVAKAHVPVKSRSYTNILFNVGLLESLSGNYDKAEPAFIELIKIDSTDYHAYAKLIQVYYHQQQYEKAKPYRARLYAAHRKNLLKGTMKDMFCFDQFKWNDKLIQSYERFEEGPKKSIYYKHVFFVLDKNEKTEFSIQSEYSPMAVEQNTGTYLLGMTKGKEHSTFGYAFSENVNYDGLKKAVLEILDGKAKPVATSTSTN